MSPFLHYTEIEKHKYNQINNDQVLLVLLVEVQGGEHHQQEEQTRGGTGEAEGGCRLVAEFLEHIAHFLPLNV